MGYYKNDLWDTKEIRHYLTIGGCASHIREIVFEKEITVKDFIEYIINYGDENDYGKVFVNGEEILRFTMWDGSTYKSELNQEKYREIKESKIKKATSDNEWYCFDFELEI